MGYSRLVLKMGIVDLDLQCDFGHFDSEFSVGNLACPRDNLQWIWARITEFVLNMHLRILSAGIENVGHWLWPSRSFGHFDSEFQETAYNVALVYWSRPAKGECTPLTCSCFIYETPNLNAKNMEIFKMELRNNCSSSFTYRHIP